MTYREGEIFTYRHDWPRVKNEVTRGRVLASKKFLPAENIVNPGARRAKNGKKIIRVARGAQNDKYYSIKFNLH